MMRRLGSNIRYTPSEDGGFSDTISIPGTPCGTLGGTRPNSKQSFVELDMRSVIYAATSPTRASRQSLATENSHPINGEAVNHSPNNSSNSDSGFSDTDTATTTNPSNGMLGRVELGRRSAHMCQQMSTITRLTADFLRDVLEDSEAPRELLHELNSKIQPFLITLDVEMSVIEQQLRKNLDESNIGDPKINWLLEYNRYHIEFRRILTELSGPVYQDLDKVLRVRDRGCFGVGPKSDTAANLKEMINGLSRADKLIKIERERPDSAYTV